MVFVRLAFKYLRERKLSATKSDHILRVFPPGLAASLIDYRRFFLLFERGWGVVVGVGVLCECEGVEQE